MVAVIGLAGMTACQTTGDPRQGGLFGWSEAKAQGRLSVRQSSVAQAEAERGREASRSAPLQRRVTETDEAISTAAAANRAATAQVDRQLGRQFWSTLQKARRLEAESPTAATASRARRLQASVQYVASNTALSVSQRMQRLQLLDSQITAQLRQLDQ